MSGTADEAKGRVKEAAGALTGDKDLKNEGKGDQAAGKVKNVAEFARDKVEGAVDAVTDKVGRLAGSRAAGARARWRSSGS